MIEVRDAPSVRCGRKGRTERECSCSRSNSIEYLRGRFKAFTWEPLNYILLDV